MAGWKCGKRLQHSYSNMAITTREEHQQCYSIDLCFRVHQCYVLGLSLASTLGQNFIYLAVTRFNPLVCSTISTTRKFFTIVFSVVMFGHPMAAHQWG